MTAEQQKRFDEAVDDAWIARDLYRESQASGDAVASAWFRAEWIRRIDLIYRAAGRLLPEEEAAIRKAALQN